MAGYVYSLASSGFSSIIHSNDRILSFLNSAHSKIGSLLGANGKLSGNACSTGKIIYSDAADNSITKIFDQTVFLEVFVQSSTINALIISGTIQVSNLAYQKEVFVRLTRDGWRSYFDITAQHQQSMYNGKTDRFVFASCVAEDDYVEFAICYRVNGMTFWDNNRGLNYCFRMCAAL